MAYEDKTQRNAHQVKVRLDDETFEKLKQRARDLSLQHSVLAREIIETTLTLSDTERERIWLDSETRRLLKQKAGELSIQDEVLAREIIDAALALKALHKDKLKAKGMEAVEVQRRA